MSSPLRLSPGFARCSFSTTNISGLVIDASQVVVSRRSRYQGKVSTAIPIGNLLSGKMIFASMSSLLTCVLSKPMLSRATYTKPNISYLPAVKGSSEPLGHPCTQCYGSISQPCLSFVSRHARRRHALLPLYSLPLFTCPLNDVLRYLNDHTARLTITTSTWPLWTILQLDQARMASRSTSRPATPLQTRLAPSEPSMPRGSSWT